MVDLPPRFVDGAIHQGIRNGTGSDARPRIRRWTTNDFEKAAMHRRRRWLSSCPAANLVTRSYWKQSTANHPDHDYGVDA